MNLGIWLKALIKFYWNYSWIYITVNHVYNINWVDAFQPNVYRRHLKKVIPMFNTTYIIGNYHFYPLKCGWLVVISDFDDNVNLFFPLMEPYCKQPTSSLECALLTLILSFLLSLFLLLLLFYLQRSWKFNIEIVTKVAVVVTNSVDFEM